MPWLPKKVVLVPVDFPQSSFDAVRLARDMVANGDGFHVLHVLAPETKHSPEVVYGHATDDDLEQRRRDLLRRKLGDIGIDGVVVKVAHGSPGCKSRTTRARSMPT